MPSAELPAIKRLFDHHACRQVVLEGGQRLYAPGDSAEALYLVRRGGLAVFRTAVDGSRLIGVIRPGEIVGESALLTGSERSALVVALRDSEVDVLSGSVFFAAARRDPEVLVEISRLLMARVQSAGQRIERPRLIGLFALSPSVSAREWAEDIAVEVRALGDGCTVAHEHHIGSDRHRWTAIEAAHDVVLCPVEHDQQAWGEVCRRQVDRLFLIADGGGPPAPAAAGTTSQWLANNGLVDLLLVQRSAPQATGAWLDHMMCSRHFHLFGKEDARRLARHLTGRAVGLALSGGGARAFAHVGATEVLRQAGVPIDAVCGTSMGAIVAAGVALGWGKAEMDRRMRAAFVSSSPLDDVALPLVAMTRGHKVEMRLAEHFGHGDIADLPLPYFCISADLGSGAAVEHRRGSLTTALRASIALPGVLPPVTVGEQVLVDGGVLRNLPTATLRAEHDGTVLAIDVSHAVGLHPADVERPRPLLRWLRSGAWRRGPPIVSILMRSATLASGPDLLAAKRAADLYVMPEVSGIEIRNWKAYDRAVEAGRKATAEALEALDVPVSELRRSRLSTSMPMPM